MSHKIVLSIGQCCADHSNISQILEKHFSVEIVNADTSIEAFSLINTKNFSLILVNRIFDSNGESGLAFIEKYCSQKSSASPIMLVSNFEDAQKDAIFHGAELGFGKNALTSSDTLSKLKKHLAN
ncbi:MAG: DNA-binding response regulator [Planctomycetes bacterium]|nr:DNA-binding response regulator [Planctomycetota bacterium]